MGSTSPEQTDKLTILSRFLRETPPLEGGIGDRLPLYIWPATGPVDLDPGGLEDLVTELWKRGVGFVSLWQDDDECLDSCLTVARIQSRIGAPVAVNATLRMYGLYDGSDTTAHVDYAGGKFFDTSFPGKHLIGCPFSLSSRIPVVAERIRAAVTAYENAGLMIDFAFSDWEIDGPLEWNGTWESAKKCIRCQGSIEGIDDFRTFQNTVRKLRSDIQRRMFAEIVTDSFPKALVGNYGVYPHDGYRYWYDYFEQIPDQPAIPVRTSGRARYREWYHEFPESGYTFGMPVVYSWDDMWDWFDFDSPDYRWIYNMLMPATNAGICAAGQVPLITFVHQGVIDTGKPRSCDPIAISDGAYHDLLWHIFLRGHDGLFVWSSMSEAYKESIAAYTVFRESLCYPDFIESGKSVGFHLPEVPGTILSARQFGNKLLVMRSDFGQATDTPCIESPQGRIAVPSTGLSLIQI